MARDAERVDADVVTQVSVHVKQSFGHRPGGCCCWLVASGRSVSGWPAAKPISSSPSWSAPAESAARTRGNSAMVQIKPTMSGFLLHRQGRRRIRDDAWAAPRTRDANAAQCLARGESQIILSFTHMQKESSTDYSEWAHSALADEQASPRVDL